MALLLLPLQALAVTMCVLYILHLGEPVEQSFHSKAILSLVCCMLLPTVRYAHMSGNLPTAAPELELAPTAPPTAAASQLNNSPGPQQPAPAAPPTAAAPQLNDSRDPPQLGPQVQGGRRGGG